MADGVQKSDKAIIILGNGPDEWVWTAIASGDVPLIRAMPATFDIHSTHPKYGSVLTCFLQGLLNLEGRFIVGESSREKVAFDILDELSRRGARPDAVIPSADFEVKGLSRKWRLVGDITPLQALVQMRNDLIVEKYESELQPSDEKLVDSESELLTQLIDKFAALAAAPGGPRSGPRLLVSQHVVDLWESCLGDGDRPPADGDLAIVSPDGRAAMAHAVLLSRASPVVSALLQSDIGRPKASAVFQAGEGSREGEVSRTSIEEQLATARRRLAVGEPQEVVQLFLTLLYTGCLPTEDRGAQSQRKAEVPKLVVGARVTVAVAFLSNSAKATLLPAGLDGEVASLDKAGDALIKFDDLPTRQWVMKKNFSRLQVGLKDDNLKLQQDLVGALNLAQLWQISWLVELIAERLECRILAGGLEVILEAAVRHDLGKLKAACLSFARKSSQARTAYDGEVYCAAVQEALSTVYGGVTNKRPRTAL
eukprot:TRINITY_DN75746_c0_g1_i1.p1 TRINITY_DN75746_c0_g1~~TRINITY_DN75746_c0_g1_i1.p1  ORF type:complete len:481 (-),score=63.02 TRINITY_DN75746_c0_g1_i1:51-1493(-)